MTEQMTTVSGIRATGRLHLGNLLGAVETWVEMQKRGPSFFFIADLHSITTGFPGREVLHGNRRDIILDLLAVGVDPDVSNVYVQSAVPETVQLAWALGCATPVARLMGMHHFAEKKDRLSQLGEDANAGLLTYPVLMTADILGPKGTHVPVGADQRQHVELARDIARAVNARAGRDLFPVPEPVFARVDRVPGLGASGKMSKSEEDTIVYLADGPDVVRRKFLRAPTDPARARRTDPGDPGRCPVYRFHELLCDGEDLRRAADGCRTARIGCVECKAMPVGRINALLAPIQERRRDLEAKGPGYVDEILEAGSRRARAQITKTLAELSDLIGLHVPSVPDSWRMS